MELKYLIGIGGYLALMLFIGYWVKNKTSTAEDYLVGGRSFNTLYNTAAQIKTFEKEADGALEVSNDRADAFIYDMPLNVVFFAEQGKGKVYHLDEPFTYEPLGIGIRQGDPDFINFINNFLHQIKNDGRYERIYDKWIKSSEWFSQTQQ